MPISSPVQQQYTESPATYETLRIGQGYTLPADCAFALIKALGVRSEESLTLNGQEVKYNQELRCVPGDTLVASRSTCRLEIVKYTDDGLYSGNRPLTFAASREAELLRYTTQTTAALTDGTLASDAIPSLRAAAHFLRQTTFGATWAEVQAAFALGSRRAWMRAELKKSFTKRFMDRLYTDEAITDLTRTDVSAEVAYSFMLGMTDTDAPLRARCLHTLLKYFPATVPGGGLPGYGGFLLLGWVDRLNQHVFGNFRNLLESVTYSRPMATMLTYNANEKASADGTTQPDENYAREIMQLFTIGLWELNADGSQRLDASGRPIPTYTNTDIRQLARAFTGLIKQNQTADFYRTDTAANRTIARVASTTQETGPIYYADPASNQRHYLPFYEYGAKYALGGRINIPENTEPQANLTAVHDALFNHPNTPVYVAGRFIRMMTTSNPSRGYVARVAAAFVDNGFGVRGDMKALWTAIFLDPEAGWDGARNEYFGRVRDGFEAWCHNIRALERLSTNGKRVFANNSAPATDAMGAHFFAAIPSIFGMYDATYSEGTPKELGLLSPEMQMWSDYLLVASSNQLSNGSIVGWEPRDTGSNFSLLRPNGYAMFPLTGTADELIERINLLLCGGLMSPGLRASLQTLLVSVVAWQTPGTMTSDQQQDRISVALQCVVGSPDYRVQL